MRERRSVQELPKWMLPSVDSSVREFFEGTAFKAGDRVQLSPATDRWMMGDRYGEVVSTTQSGLVRVKLDKSGLTLRFKPELLQQLFREQLPGGRAAGRRPAEFDANQLRRGITVELEHTSDPRLAEEIAMDHLVEDPQYYDKLLRAGL